MTDRNKELTLMVEEINRLADRLIADSYAFKYKVAKRLLFVASLGVLVAFVTISMYAYLN